MHSDVLPVADLFNKPARAVFLAPLLEQLRRADVVCAHNVRRFDLRVLNAEAMRLGLPLLRSLLVQDTIRLPRSKGFKKGLDNLAVLLDTLDRKRSLNWQEWQDAYGDPTLAEVRARVESDARITTQVRVKAAARGWLKPPMPWSS